jgi:hypothetical protein
MKKLITLIVVLSMILFSGLASSQTVLDGLTNLANDIAGGTGVTVTDDGDGTITISLPQAVGTTDDVAFNIVNAASQLFVPMINTTSIYGSLSNMVIVDATYINATAFVATDLVSAPIINAEDGTEAAPSLEVGDDGDSGFYEVNDDQIRLVLGGTNGSQWQLQDRSFGFMGPTAGAPLTIATIDYSQSDDGLHFTVRDIDGGGNRNLIFTDYANATADHDHDTLSTNPTIFIHSALDPDTNNTRWMSLFHNGVAGAAGYGAIETGSGDLYLNPASDTVTIANSITVTDLLTVSIGNVSSDFSFSLTGPQMVPCDAAAGDVDAGLPALSSVTSGTFYGMKKIDSSGNSCIWNGNGSETIDGSEVQSISAQNTAEWAFANTTGWLLW